MAAMQVVWWERKEALGARKVKKVGKKQLRVNRTVVVVKEHVVHCNKPKRV